MRRWIGWLAVAVLVAGGSAAAWVWYAGGSGEPSTDLTTPPIGVGSSTTSTGTSPSDSITIPTGTQAPVGEALAFVIDPSQSTATYEVDEILRGEPNRVVGTTNEVAGQVLVDPTDLSGIEFSVILINARTFETDDARRDRQVRGPLVLNSAADEFELISFEVTRVDGLPDSVSVGETVTATVVGGLTIKGTTRETAFELSASMPDQLTLAGSATTVVLRSDFGIDIPRVASVAGVDDEVTIRLDFVAPAS